MNDQAPAYAQALEQLRAERDAAQARANAAERQWEAIASTPDGGWHVAHERAAAQLAEVTAERDHMRSVIPELEAQLDHWKGKYVEPRTPTDLEMQTGPVAFERNQLRDELAELRPQVEDLRAKLAAAEHRATMHERDAERMARAADTLETMFNAAISAVSRGNP